LAGVKSGIELLTATIDIDPDTLNLNSKGRWITCYIELPEGYDVRDIDLSTVVLEGTVYAESRPTRVGDHDSDGILDLMVKFDRSQVAGLLEPAEEVTITVEGEVGDTRFSGTDTIRVIDKGKKGKDKDKGKKDKNGTLLASPSPETSQQASGLYYYHLDHLGTPQMMTDEDGNVVWAADYKPFGQADVTVNTGGNNFRFPGQYHDEETGLHYNYHRYYHPNTGRYLSPDPSNTKTGNPAIPFLLSRVFQGAGRFHSYLYCSQNPLSKTDEFGLDYDIVPSPGFKACVKAVQNDIMPRLRDKYSEYDRCLKKCELIRRLKCMEPRIRELHVASCKVGCFFSLQKDVIPIRFESWWRVQRCWLLYQLEKQKHYRGTE